MRMAAIACGHGNRIETNGEVVCSACGMVMQEGTVEAPYEGSSRTNLFERHATGSKNLLPKAMETDGLRAYLRSEMRDRVSVKEMDWLRKFSNSAQKLGLNRNESEYAFRLFRRGRETTGSRQYAFVAAWALYKSAKVHGVPITGKEAIAVVRGEFRKAHFPDMTKMLYKMMDVETPHDNDMVYNFRAAIMSVLEGREYLKGDYSEMERLAWALYNDVYTTGSYPSRARAAVCEAFGVAE